MADNQTEPGRVGEKIVIPANVNNIVNKYFGEYKVKGNEIIPTYCPLCQGGKHRDKHTFSLNVDKMAYQCFRGSCSSAGTFLQLCKMLGAETPTYDFRKEPKVYEKPKTVANPASSAVEKYMEGRGISKDTLKLWKVGEKDGNIVFPYYEDGELVSVKFRPVDPDKGKSKTWKEPGGKPVFWGMDDCKPEMPLIIVEGEIDALTLSEVGFKNVTSVYNGANDLTCLDECWDWITQFRQVIIWPDNDTPGMGLCRKLISKLGSWRCAVVQTTYQDANDALMNGGREAVADGIDNAQEVPMAGLVRLADVEMFDINQAIRVPSSIKEIDQEIGGYFMGQLSCWTGITGSGKSTFLGQEILTAIDNGYSVCAYSGELPGSLFRYWIDLQAAGPGNIEMKMDPFRDRESYKPKQEIVPYIREWYQDNFYLLDVFGGVTIEKVIEVFTYAAQRYDCKVFLLDNLMTLASPDFDKDLYRKQSQLVGELKDFAHQQMVHVHLVAHPRKTEGRISKMDVMGSGDIINRVDNLLALHRFGRDDPEVEEGWGGSIDIFKNRLYGQQQVEILVRFEPKSKRFFKYGAEKEHAYGWRSLVL